MKEILEPLFELPENTFDDWLLFILMWVIFLGLIAFVIGFIYWAVDSWFPAAHYTDTGVIVDHKYTAAYTTTTTQYVNNSPIITTQYHPEDYSLFIELKDQVCSISVARETYYEMQDGRSVTCDYIVGRLSKWYYIQSIQ